MDADSAYTRLTPARYARVQDLARARAAELRAAAVDAAVRWCRAALRRAAPAPSAARGHKSARARPAG